MISRRRGSDSCQAEIKESLAGAVPGEPLGSSFRRKKRLWSRRVTWLWLWPGATWSMVNGQWSMVNGQWSMVNGRWLMGVMGSDGRWTSVAAGAWPMAAPSSLVRRTSGSDNDSREPAPSARVKISVATGVEEQSMQCWRCSDHDAIGLLGSSQEEGMLAKCGTVAPQWRKKTLDQPCRHLT